MFHHVHMQELGLGKMFYIKTSGEKKSSDPAYVAWWTDLLRTSCRMTEPRIARFLSNGRDIVFCGLHFLQEDLEQGKARNMVVRFNVRPRDLLSMYGQVVAPRVNYREGALERQEALAALAAVAVSEGLAADGGAAFAAGRVDLVVVQQQQMTAHLHLVSTERNALAFVVMHALLLAVMVLQLTPIIAILNPNRAELKTAQERLLCLSTENDSLKRKELCRLSRSLHEAADVAYVEDEVDQFLFGEFGYDMRDLRSIVAAHV
jgi:hypothetical protein